ncbi:MAG TPA: V-type ATP synthase subunit A, partial [bacterium]|nr:V-type ATP synthase subunit A [bacterium]
MERKRIKQGRVARISGPLVVAKELEFVKMHEVVRVGELGLVGEVMEIRGGEVFLQVYEETAGLMPGEKVEATGEPLSVELGPGLLGCIYDGIQRPLARIRDIEGDYIGRGVSLPGLDREKVWDFFPTVKTGDIVSGGDRMAEVQETAAVKHRILVPPGIKGRVKKIEAGRFKAEDTVCVLETDGGEKKLNMIQRWHVREPRPYKEKLPVKEPLITGTRVIDTFFPIAQGGTAAIPGPFGSGKTVVLHQLAKWSDADI